MHAPSNTVKTNKMKFLQGALLSALDSSVLNHLFFFISRNTNASEFSSTANVGLAKMRAITSRSMERQTTACARGTVINLTIPRGDTTALNQWAESFLTSFTK